MNLEVILLSWLFVSADNTCCKIIYKRKPSLVTIFVLYWHLFNFISPTGGLIAFSFWISIEIDFYILKGSKCKERIKIDKKNTNTYKDAAQIRNILVTTRDADRKAAKHECLRRKLNPTTGVQRQFMANM